MDCFCWWVYNKAMFNKLKNHLLENHLNYKIIGIFAVVVIVVTIPLLISKQGKPSLEKDLKPKISIICPTIKSFCDEKNEIVKDGKSIALGGLLLIKTPVYAVFDGKITKRSVTIQKKEGGIERYEKITLISQDDNLIAEYFFQKAKVKTYKNSIVKKGDPILTIDSNEKIPMYKDYNFVFELFNKNQDNIFINEIEFVNSVN